MLEKKNQKFYLEENFTVGHLGTSHRDLHVRGPKCPKESVSAIFGEKKYGAKRQIIFEFVRLVVKKQQQKKKKKKQKKKKKKKKPKKKTKNKKKKKKKKKTQKRIKTI